jgi:Secretion system C-terminal sorting domain
MNRLKLLSKAAIACCFAFFFVAMGRVNAYPPILKINWDNGMGQSWSEANGACVQLSSDNTVYIGMTIYTAQISVGSQPPIGVRYTMKIGGVNVLNGVTPVYNNFTNTTVDGYPVQEQKIIIPFDCNAFCRTPGMHFYADFTFEVVVGSSASSPLYDVGNHDNNLWPWATFQEITGTGYTVVKTITKEICCYRPPLPISSNGSGTVAEYDENLAEIASGTVQTPLKQQGGLPINPSLAEQVLVSPNPFQSELSVRFNLLVSGKVSFECLDTQGRVLKKMEEQYEEIGMYETQFELADIPPGLYYLRVLTPTGTQISKIIKSKV